MPRIPLWLSRLTTRSIVLRITLPKALTLSLLVHCVLLALHFDLPEKLKSSHEQLLEVVLVNARHATRPKKSQVRAQANLDGGGNTEENRIAKTPLPASKQKHVSDRLQEAQKRVAELEALQKQLLTQLKQQEPARTTASGAEVQHERQPLRGADLATSALAMARLQGQIDRQTERYNKRPRKKFIGARATEYRFAQYEEDWRQKIERVGNLNYPEAAKGRVYGSLVLTVEINADGTIASLQVDRSSGVKLLDEAAMRIVRLAAPFPAFPPNLSDTDIIGITRTWSFTSEDRLQAN
ncbi:MAG: TonB family protein [Sterolibacterium sp.]|nr:TonB family protein [Sterolibacterium sp.]